MNSDGKVIIDTQLETKNFDKKYNRLKTKLENEEIKLQIKGTDLENAKQELQAVNNELKTIKKQRDEINRELEKYQKQYDTLNNRISGGDSLTGEEYQRFGFLDNKLTDLKNKQAEINAEYDKYNTKVNKSYDLLTKAESQYNIQENKVQDIRLEFEELNSEITKTTNDRLAKMQDSLENVGKSVSGVVKKVGKWALAIFGVRSAYMFIRQAMSTLSQYNEQLATDVEYIRYALAVSLQPLIEAIIKLAYQLLGILNSITKNLFGWDMFKNAGVNAFKKVNGSAKELQKTLAGFDKLNILNENGTTGAAGGVTPSIDLSKMGDADVSGTVRLLDKIKVLFDKTFDDIVGNVEKVLIDLGASPRFVAKWKETLGSVKQTFEGLIDFIIGLAKIAVGFLTGDTELVEEGFNQAIGGIGQSIDGLSDTILNIRDLTIITLGDLIKELGKFALKARAKIEEAIFNFAFELGKGAALYMAESFKSIINSVFSLLERKLNEKIAVINGLITGINSIPGINIGKINAIKLPRLAAGGIVNMPGRGVMVGSAIAGEKGREGVVPLDNKQSLETIGRTIAKYASFNADITLEIENRVLARVQKELNADRQFARNGG